MTQPDEYFPEDAANYGSFSAWSQKTQEDYENERYDKENTRWGKVRTGLRWEIPDGWALGHWYQSVLTEHTEAIANLNDIAAASNTTPLWVSDLDDMASFPRSDLAVLAGATKYFDIDGVYTYACADSAHNHTWHWVCPVFQPTTQALPTRGHIYYIPIIANRVGLPTAVRWIAGADTSIFSVDKYYMSLCAYNPSNGNVEKLWDSGDIKDAEANTTSLQEVEIATGLTDPDTDATTPGQLLFVAHQQIAPGGLQSPRRFAAKAMSGIGRPGLLHNAACYVAEGYSDGIPSSISFASLTRENTILPWASIRMEAVEEGS